MVLNCEVHIIVILAFHLHPETHLDPERVNFPHFPAPQGPTPTGLARYVRQDLERLHIPSRRPAQPAQYRFDYYPVSQYLIYDEGFYPNGGPLDLMAFGRHSRLSTITEFTEYPSESSSHLAVGDHELPPSIVL